MCNIILLACPACRKTNPVINELEFSTQIMCSSSDGCNFNVTAASENDAIIKWNKRKKCPGIDLGDGNFSGCDQSHGDCPVCGL